MLLTDFRLSGTRQHHNSEMEVSDVRRFSFRSCRSLCGIGGLLIWGLSALALAQTPPAQPPAAGRGGRGGRGAPADPAAQARLAARVANLNMPLDRLTPVS